MGKWNKEDAVEMGKSDDQFDDTFLRLDQNEYSSITKAVDALNAGKLRCSEGICICFSSNAEVYFLLVRTDKKDEGMRVLFESKEQERANEELQQRREEYYYQKSRKHAIHKEAMNAKAEDCEFSVGQRVSGAGRDGVVRYIGECNFQAGLWVGIELDG